MLQDETRCTCMYRRHGMVKNTWADAVGTSWWRASAPTVWVSPRGGRPATRPIRSPRSGRSAGRSDGSALRDCGWEFWSVVGTGLTPMATKLLVFNLLNIHINIVAYHTTRKYFKPYKYCVLSLGSFYSGACCVVTSIGLFFSRRRAGLLATAPSSELLSEPPQNCWTDASRLRGG